MSDEQWQAVAVDGDGFVLDDETLRAWAKAIEDGATGWAVPCEPPVGIEIVRGSAAPQPQSDSPDEKFYRLPGSWRSVDKFLELDDLDEQEPRDVLLLWERAQAAAAGMNAASVR